MGFRSMSSLGTAIGNGLSHSSSATNMFEAGTQTPTGMSLSSGALKKSRSSPHIARMKSPVPPINAACKEKIEEYCRGMGGDRPIHSVLIANNGIAAVKFIRSVRTWAYETFSEERAVLLVAMATPEDLRVNAEHIRMADQFVEVPGGTNNNNYANVQLILEVAERTGVDAVWPGWGHASENPDLPEALARTPRKIVFLGPHSNAMALLGDKIGSTIIAQAAGVPTVAWSGSEVRMPMESCREPIPEATYQRACVQTPEEAMLVCQKIGYPAMIKASWGGGGKGIRKVHNDEEVKALFKQVQGEVPGSPIFIMKLAAQSRHLEVQLLCDQHGNVVALHSRDCSVQRRHQKIIEEGPITAASADTVRLLEDGACRLARAVGYVGAATVEYLYTEADGAFYFLELNPRLQVEHPVTEWIAGINLPSSQLNVGMGIPLWKFPEVRRLFGRPAGGNHDTWQTAASLAQPFDFESTARVKPRGHVVAVRVTSEDPEDGFKPTSGRIQELSFKGRPDVWAYFSVKSGGGIHEFSDSQFGHLFAFGESRAAACANMVLALKELIIRGEIRTNVDYAVDLIQSKEYQENRIHTGWLDSRIAMRVRVERPKWHISVLGGALYRSTMLVAARVSEFIGYLEKGQIPPKEISLVNFDVSLNIEGIKYHVAVTKKGPNSYRLQLNSSQVDGEVHTLRDGGLLMQFDGNSHVVYAEEEANGTRLLIDGRTCLLQNDHDPSRLIAETPFKLLRFLVDDGHHVNADEAYVEVEVMKMCMPLLTPAAGVIKFKASEGSSVQAGDLIAALDLDDSTAVKRAVPFEGSLPELGTPTAVTARAHQHFAAALEGARMVLAGYDHDIDTVVETLLSCLDDPHLPLLQWQETMSVLSARLPKELRLQLDTIWQDFRLAEALASEDASFEFPASYFRETLEEFVASVSEKEQLSLRELVGPLVKLARSYEEGREGHARATVGELFDEYMRVEQLFSDQSQADVIEGLRKEHKKHLERVVDVVLSHQGVRRKNALLLRIMGSLVLPSPGAYSGWLHKLAMLSHASQTEVAVRSNQLLETNQLSELQAHIARTLSELDMFAADQTDSPRRQSKRGTGLEERMNELADAPLPIEDALAALFDHADRTLLSRVIETYVRRLYQPYLVRGSIQIKWDGPALGRRPRATWRFVDTATSAAESDARWGSMVVLPSLRLLAPYVRAVLTDIRTQGNIGQGNVLHLVLLAAKESLSMSMDSGDEEAAQERVEKLTSALSGSDLSRALLQAGVGAVSCILQRDEGRSPARHHLEWLEADSRFRELALLRHVEPLLSDLLELEKLPTQCPIQYASSRDRQWHIYTTLEKPNIRRMFLRALVRQPFLTTPFSTQTKPEPTSNHQGYFSQFDGQASGTFCESDSSPQGELGPDSRGRFSETGLESSRAGTFSSHSDPLAQQGGVAAAAAACEALIRSMKGALEELEVATHDHKADHVHLYMSVLQELDLQRTTEVMPVAEVRRLSRGISTGEDSDLADGVNSFAREDSRSESSHKNTAVGGQNDSSKSRLEIVTNADIRKPLALQVDARTTLQGTPSETGTVVQEQSANPLFAAESGAEKVVSVLQRVVKRVSARLGKRLYKQGVATWEVRIVVRLDQSEAATWRVVVESPCIQGDVIEVYREGAVDKHRVYLSADSCPRGKLHGTPLTAQYGPLGSLEKRRLAARRAGTTFCFDFPLVFSTALAAIWEAELRPKPPGFPEPISLNPSNPPTPSPNSLWQRAQYNSFARPRLQLLSSNSTGATQAFSPPLTPLEPEVNRGQNAPPAYPTEPLVESRELIWSTEGGGLVGTDRPSCGNSIGMVAWRMTLRTPECAGGREVVVVANDCTLSAGSFGPKEDAFFRDVTELAAAEGLPLLYLAANSGARIGVAREVQAAFRVGWVDDGRPNEGFQYLYLTDGDFEKFGSSVFVEKVELPSGEIRHVLTGIVGQEDGLGVENLSGSGLIAGAYARAYQETFTLTYVTGRTVGIGAYLARLGQRCIQRLDQPIILTGFSALNKLLGREVYTSHMQLGGPHIMANNGVVHRTVSDDLEGCTEILRWLGYVPERVGSDPPIKFWNSDPVERPVAYTPEQMCDPRAAIQGTCHPTADVNGSPHSTAGVNGSPHPTVGINESPHPTADESLHPDTWLGGIFDRGSFTEALAGWARTVVTGRARLGGIPVGVIAVQTQAVMCYIPADPGQPDSAERAVPQAGQVWFPDSAAKTAQALLDFKKEGLPLFILANWRGFSGGQRDLFEGVLQAGSCIVENLRTYSSPVFVYIPKTGELRGGAWVVVDSQINSDMVEMYADPSARGNVLEPEGLVEIKYRSAQLVETMHRLDQGLGVLDRQLEEERKRPQPLPGRVKELQDRIKDRERLLRPIFQQVALRFADLHDTPQRMAAKGVIAGIVPWEQSRAVFYKRLRRRLAEESLLKRIVSAGGASVSRQDAKAHLRRWAASCPNRAAEGASAASQETSGVAQSARENASDAKPAALGAVREASGAYQGSAAAHDGTPGAHQETPRAERGSVLAQNRHPGAQQGPDAAHQGTLGSDCKSLDAHQKDTSAHREFSKAKRASPSNPSPSANQSSSTPSEAVLTNPAASSPSGTDAFWADDDAVVAWCEENRAWIDDQLRALRMERVARTIVELAGGDEGQAGLLKGLQALLEKQEPAQECSLVEALRQIVWK